MGAWSRAPWEVPITSLLTWYLLAGLFLTAAAAFSYLDVLLGDALEVRP